MAVSVNNLVPRVAALAIVGYCIWPSISELMSKPESKPTAPLPELAASLFSPTMPPIPMRNPFTGGRMEPQSKNANSLAKGGSATASGAGNANKQTGNANKAKAATGGEDLLAQLSLNATCIVGNQRLAIISGRLYAVQETLADVIPVTPPYKIVNVLPYKVVLEREGKLTELLYSNAPRQSPLSQKSDVQTKPTVRKDESGHRKPRLTLTGTESGVRKSSGTTAN